MNWKNFKIGQKLAIGFGLLIIISCILGAIAVINMSNISTQSNYLANEYVPEVEVANSIERHSLLTMFNMRGYGFTEETRFLNTGREELKKLKSYLKDAESLARESTQLVKLEGAIDETNSSVDSYESLVNKTVELNAELEADRADMDKNAALFIDNCTSYLNSQNESFNREANQGASASALNERLNKITWINDIIDQGNTLRIENFKAQALRDPVLFKAAIDKFSIDEELRKLRSVTYLDADIEALNTVENSADDHVGSMQNFIKAWEQREQVAAERTDVANVVLANAQDVSLAGIEQTNNIAQEAVDLLKSSSTIMIIGLIVALIIGVILAYIITQSITMGIKKGVGFAQLVAQGNLSTNMDNEYLTRNDEIGDLGKALQLMVDKLRDIIGSVL